MRLELGSPVHCTDGRYGVLADIVIDPIRQRVTHLAVEPTHRHDLARLVPIAGARPPSTSGEAGVQLDDTRDELDKLELLQKSAYLRLGETPVEDPDWDVGIENILALPYYQSFTPGGLGTGLQPLLYDEHITDVYDRVPKDQIEVRRASGVISS